MSKVTAAQVRELRDATDAPMMDCKKALDETGGDVKAAIDFLRKRGMSKAAKKAGREMSEGRVASYIHFNGKVGSMVEMQCETDFCANNDDFTQVLNQICMHVAANDPVPVAVSSDDIPADLIEGERKIYLAQAAESGKPEAIREKMVQGRIDKFKKEHALLEQPYMGDGEETIGQMVTALVAKLGENISVKRFARFKIGS
ncbi:MAG: translation elongation factor Ts [Planctomycetota bacterium]